MFFSIHVVFAALWRLMTLAVPSKRFAGIRGRCVLRGNYFTDLVLVAIVLLVLAGLLGAPRTFWSVVAVIVVAALAAHGIDTWRQRQYRIMRERVAAAKPRD